MAIAQAPTKDEGAANGIKCAGQLEASSALPEQKKACHQCRQVTAKLGPACGKTRSGKPCPIRYCSRCLLNRYGEKAGQEGAWSCPKCRDVCNCSVCMKKKGHAPTGVLAPKAKATGFVSVLDMLRRKVAATDIAAAEKKEAEKKLEKSETAEDSATLVPPTSPAATALETTMEPSAPSTPRNSNQSNGAVSVASIDSGTETGNDIGKYVEMKTPAKKVKTPAKKRKVPDGVESNAAGDGLCQKEDVEAENGSTPPMKPGSDFPKIKNPRKKRVTGGYTDDHTTPCKVVDIPAGTCLTTVAGFEFAAEDVGPVLQFLEFCAAFGEVLGLKKGQPESILRDLFRGRAARWASNPVVAQFHSMLLSLTGDNKATNTPVTCPKNKIWLQDLQKYATSLYGNGTRYDVLDPSKRLRLLNYLCDEVLGSECIRSWIEEDNTKFIEKKKEDRENIRIAKEKEKEMNQIQTNENELEGDSPKLTKLAAKLDSDSAPKRNQRSDAVRTSSVAIDENGRAFWKLKGHYGGSRIIFQSIEDWNDAANADQDKWFCYDDNEEKVVEKHIFSQRNWRLTRHRILMRCALQDTGSAAVEDTCHDAMECSLN